MAVKIAIIASHDGEKIKSSTFELFAFAKKLGKHITADNSFSGNFSIRFSIKFSIRFIIIGENTKALAENLSSQTGCSVIAADVENTGNYHGEIHKKTLTCLLNKYPHDYVLAPHSTSGMDYAPALSIALRASHTAAPPIGGSCITGVEDIKTEEGKTYFVRAMLNGKIHADFLSPDVSASSPLIITVQPGAFKPVQPDEKSSFEVTMEKLDFPEDKMKYKGKLPSPSMGSNLAKAEVIISGGRGIEEEENYKFIEMLAGIFPRAATGASRPICDYGWVPYTKQVGATGTIVSPGLYVACGISGSTQHIEGIRDSRLIVVINKDPDAPIFKVADICIIEDLVTFIPVLVEEFNKRKTLKQKIK
jgi:electron transfer flavoprotein alpha subunit